MGWKCLKIDHLHYTISVKLTVRIQCKLPLLQLRMPKYGIFPDEADIRLLLLATSRAFSLDELQDIIKNGGVIGIGK